MTVFTIGHSTRTLEAFIAALKSADVDMVVDVRRFPGSRRLPQFNAGALAAALAAEGIVYSGLTALGGRRGPRQDGPSHNALWREAAFRNYADYAESAEFRAGLQRLIELAQTHRPAIMCAEALWWRCHRRIIADYLIAAGIPVVHILDRGKVEPARLTPGAMVEDGGLLYPGRAADG